MVVGIVGMGLMGGSLRPPAVKKHEIHRLRRGPVGRIAFQGAFGKRHARAADRGERAGGRPPDRLRLSARFFCGGKALAAPFEGGGGGAGFLRRKAQSDGGDARFGGAVPAALFHRRTSHGGAGVLGNRACGSLAVRARQHDIGSRLRLSGKNLPSEGIVFISGIFARRGDDGGEARRDDRADFSARARVVRRLCAEPRPRADTSDIRRAVFGI